MTERQQEKQIFKVTLVGSLANFLLLIFKFAAGILGHSGALIADAVHSLSDFITDIIVLVFVHIAKKPEDKKHPYGHGKFETLATVIIGTMLLCVGFGLFITSSKTIWHFFQGIPIKSPGYIALIMAVISVIVKEGLYRYTQKFGEKINSKVVIANALHHRSDAWSSVGASIGVGGAIVLGKQWTVLDPIAAIFVSLLIVKVSFELLLPCLNELLDATAPVSVEDDIRQIITTCDGVNDLHHLRVRRVGNYYAIEMHIRMDGKITLNEAHEKATEVEHKIKDAFGERTYINIHVEPLRS